MEHMIDAIKCFRKIGSYYTLFLPTIECDSPLTYRLMATDSAAVAYSLHAF